jgi:hypothetical protein
VKTGLKTEANKYLILILFLFNYNISAQISLKGFCKYNTLETAEGYNHLLALNYNNDAYTDLLLYSPARRRFSLIEGDNTGSFMKQNEIRFKEPVSAIKNLSINEGYNRSYITISRKGRTASVINFNEDGRVFILDEIKFDSYPEKIDVGDASRDQSPDVLISGSGFDGISLLHIRKGKISETKVIKGAAFREAVFTDFNNDGYPDITAVNMYERSLQFYYNNTRGKFFLSSSVPLSMVPLTLASTDIDLDYFEDIILSDEKSITILYGDELSSYENNVVLQTSYVPHKVITGDFNSDGSIDIAYADTASGIVSVFFADDERNFDQEYLLFKKNRITSLVPFYSRFITGMAAYSSDGRIYIISQFQSVGEEVSITAGVKPGVLNPFDYTNNGINDIAYIDEEEPSLNLLARDNSGVPEKLYKHKLHYPHKEIITDNFSKEVKVFYCWTRGEKLIEIITADFNENKLSRTSLYTTDKIHELKIKPVKGKPAVIYAAYINNGKAGANIFEFYDFRYIRADYNSFALDVEDISPFITEKEDGFFTWQRRSSLNLYFHSIRNLAEFSRVGEINNKDLVITYTADILNSGLPTQIAYDGRGIYMANKAGIYKVASDSLPSIIEKNQFWTGEIKAGGLKRLFIYIPERRSLDRITLFNRGKNLILSQLISGISVNRYFVKNMGVADYHIVYSDPEENCITIKRIK